MVFYAFDVKSAFNESLLFERGLKGKKKISKTQDMKEDENDTT